MGKQKNYLLLVIKGCCMGAADVVPGVSGGTIAFITGIYEELIDSIKNINLQALRLLFHGQFREFWKKINGNFLISVFCGIGISILSLAKLMNYLLGTHPIEIWSFFFGLIIASALLVARKIKKWDIFTFLALAAGCVSAYTITVLSPASTPQTWWFILLSGAIAICAMILPGISGAFILLLLGKYTFIMAAVSELRIGTILLFAAGAIIGLISFSHFLSWLLKNYHTLTIALLTGFMLGSLNKVWPWKESLEFFKDTHGIQQVLIEKNVSPTTFGTLQTCNGKYFFSENLSMLNPCESGQAMIQADPLLGHAVIMCLIGFFLIWGIEYSARKLKK